MWAATAAGFGVRRLVAAVEVLRGGMALPKTTIAAISRRTP